MYAMHVGAAKTDMAIQCYFAKYVPLGTEVVVNYKPHVSDGSTNKFRYLTGVALIPKKQKKEKFENE